MAEKKVRKTTTKKPVKKAAPKKSVVKSVSAPKTLRKKPVAKSPARKAPTAVAQVKRIEKKNNIVLISGSLFFMLVIGVSVAIGVSGDGEISIEARIMNMKEDATPEERSKIISVPVQKTSLPDGGLVPSGVPDIRPEPEVHTSSTESTATSTESVSTTTSESSIDDPPNTEVQTSSENATISAEEAL